MNPRRGLLAIAAVTFRLEVILIVRRGNGTSRAAAFRLVTSGRRLFVVARGGLGLRPVVTGLFVGVRIIIVLVQSRTLSPTERRSRHFR